ncbi:MAG: arginine deiminase family protein [Cytophagales bacterium]
MIKVNSEIGQLKRIIVHSPDDGIEQVTPDKAVEYLYEDIVFLDKMKKEHDVFRKVLEAFVGANNVLDIQDLVEEICQIEKVKVEIVKTVCEFENKPALEARLMSFSAKNLAYTLITGIPKGAKKPVLSPISNFIFCRDIGVVINNHVLVAQANKRARCRESILSWFVYHHSSVFAGIVEHNRLIQLSNDKDELIENLSNTFFNELSIEGGDVMTFGEGHVFIGVSERTTKYAFEKAKDIIFKKGVVDDVTMVEIPRERYCMHLDTIFTRIDENVCVVFAPLILNDNKLKVKRFHKGKEKAVVYKSLKDLLLEIKPNMQFIECGGGKTPHAEREQWTDGCNLFAIKPGVAVTYERNKYTTKAIEKAGYKVYKAEILLKKFKTGELNAESLENTLILIPSNELSRARGGTHCLTFPIWRE